MELSLKTDWHMSRSGIRRMPEKHGTASSALFYMISLLYWSQFMKQAAAVPGQGATPRCHTVLTKIGTSDQDHLMTDTECMMTDTST